VYGLPTRRRMTRRRSVATALAAGVAAMLCAPNAHAELSIANMNQPTVDPFVIPQNAGELLSASSRQEQIARVRIGEFLLLNRAGLTTVYDDNVFASPSNEVSDFFTNADAQMSLASTWSRHSLELYVGGGGNFYAEVGGETTGYANLGVNSRLDIGQDSWLRAFGKYSYGFETRGTGESFRRYEEPIQKQSAEGGFLLHNAFTKVWTEIGVTVRKEQFFDAKFAGPGGVATVDQSFRDSIINELTSRLGYEFSPKTSAYVESVYEARDYEDNRFDADGYKLLAGLRAELNRVLSADVAIGFMHYDAARQLADIDTWTYHAQLVYAISPTVTAALVGSRELGSPSEFTVASHRIESEIGLRADYEVHTDVLLMAGAGFGWVDYVDSARADEYLRLTAGVEYRWRPWLMLWANFAYLQHASNLSPDIDFDKSVIRAGLQLTY
jgi:hypothetical protein